MKGVVVNVLDFGRSICEGEYWFRFCVECGECEVICFVGVGLELNNGEENIVEGFD